MRAAQITPAKIYQKNTCAMRVTNDLPTDFWCLATFEKSIILHPIVRKSNHAQEVNILLISTMTFIEMSNESN